MRTHRTVDSPVGPLTLVQQDGGLAALVMGEWPAQETGERDDAALPEAVEQLAQWFAGERTAFDLPLTAAGTPWQQRVWQALREIPYGSTAGYGEIAAVLGRPGAARAVGAANGRNPVGIVVPCHRVVGSSGTLTGYAGGLERKRWLLEHERAVLARG